MTLQEAWESFWSKYKLDHGIKPGDVTWGDRAKAWELFVGIRPEAEDL